MLLNQLFKLLVQPQLHYQQIQKQQLQQFWNQQMQEMEQVNGIVSCRELRDDVNQMCCRVHLTCIKISHPFSATGVHDLRAFVTFPLLHCRCCNVLVIEKWQKKSLDRFLLPKCNGKDSKGNVDCPIRLVNVFLFM